MIHEASTPRAPGSPRIASLGMYDMPWVQAANDALWTAIAARLHAQGVDGVPPALNRADDLAAIWHSPDLLLAQTCGYPLVTSLAGVVEPIAAPVYAAHGCSGATHCSLLIVPASSGADRLDALRGGRVAANGPDSNTGMNLLRAVVAPLADGGRFFGEVVWTGGHLASLATVAAGAADLTAIDAVTFDLTARHRPNLVADVRIIGETPPSPTLPFVTRASTSPEAIAVLREAMAEALADPAVAWACDTLGLVGIVPVTRADYAVVTSYEIEAVLAGYPILA